MKYLKRWIFSIRSIRYFFFLLSIIIFVYSVQIFTQNFNMDQTISKIKNEHKYLSWQTYWLKNYYEPYLKSKYSHIIFSHKNAILREWEFLVKINFYDKNNKNNIKFLDKKIEKSNLSWQELFYKIKKQTWINFIFF